MPTVRTAADLGHAIRARRKALGWDQARLAETIGVSRQWVIDIEKGKPRAELELVLRAANVLGLNLFISPLHDVPAPTVARPTGTRPPTVDIDSIIERNRTFELRGVADSGASLAPPWRWPETPKPSEPTTTRPTKAKPGNRR